MIKSLFCFLLVSLPLFSMAQIPEDYSYLLEEHGNKDYVILYDNTSVRIKKSKEKGVEIIKTEDLRIYLTSDDAALFSNDKVHSSFFQDLLNIEAYALNKNGNRYAKSKVTEFDSKETISNDVFFDDITITSFQYEGLRKESIIHLSYEVELTDPHLSISQIFGTSSPLLEKSLSIEVDNDIDIAVSYFNMDDNYANYSKEIGKKTTVYRWVKNDFDIIKREESSLNVRYYLPHMVARIKSYTDDSGKTVNVLRNVEDLHNWYKSFLKDVTCDNEGEINTVIKSLSLSNYSEKEKVKKVFEWVQNNIKYIAIEDGLGGFIPRNPDLVMNRRYGDCKDMATLIVQMLGMLGIEANKVWIGTDEIPYRYDELPTPVVDNHMIAAYFDKENNQYIFLDATDSKVSFGFPTQFIQGKEALIHKGETFEIVEVPIVPSFKNEFIDSADLRIAEDMLLGEGKLSLTGFYANDFKHHLGNIKTEESKKSHVKAVTQKGNNKYKLTDYKIDVSDNALNYSYRFDLSNYVFKNENEIYVNLNLDQFNDFFDPYTEDRKLDVKERFTSSTNFYYNLLVPDGYMVDYIPENLVVRGEDYEVKITYELVNANLLKYSFELDLNYLVMNSERVSEIYEMGKKVKSAYKESVVLKKL